MGNRGKNFRGARWEIPARLNLNRKVSLAGPLPERLLFSDKTPHRFRYQTHVGPLLSSKDTFSQILRAASDKNLQYSSAPLEPSSGYHEAKSLSSDCT